MPDYAYPVRRTPEQGHSARCLAKALICAVENARDAALHDANLVGQPWMADHQFRLWAQENTFLSWADGYLSDGVTECICPDEEGAQRLRDQA
jgi:hypothetical protein